MAKISSITEITSIKPGPTSKVLPDGTIQDPEAYEALDVEFDDGVIVQVERPVTKLDIKLARDAALASGATKIDDIAVGDEIV